jgi:aminoglycoside phosphotransferase (APT) family kinase protein
VTSTWQADPERWRELAPLLRAALPAELKGEPYFLGAGDTSIAFLIDDHVARLPRHEDAVKSQAREACVLTRIAARLPLEVPRHTIIPASEALPSFSLHRRVPGEELPLDAWLKMPRRQQTELAGTAGNFLEALHSVPIDRVHDCALEVSDPFEQAASIHERARASIYGFLPAETVKRIDAVVHRYVSDRSRWSYRPAILHCDFGPGHLLYDSKESVLTGVIDFGDVTIGDPARDFIFLGEDWNAGFLSLALERYSLEPREQLLPRIEITNLLNLLWWTLWVKGRNLQDQLEHGLRELTRLAANSRG